MISVSIDMHPHHDGAKHVLTQVVINLVRAQKPPSSSQYRVHMAIDGTIVATRDIEYCRDEICADGRLMLVAHAIQELGRVR